MNRLHVAIVGCGRISRKHVEAIERIPELQLIGACDLNMERAERLVKGRNARAFGDQLEMARELKPDIAVVLVDSGAHKNAVCALAPYVRHIVVEKPIALRLDDADEMITVCEQAGVSLFVVKQNRYNPPIQKLQEAIQGGRFGRLALGTVRLRWCRTQEYYDEAAWRGTWAQDGGVFANQAAHLIDLLQWMMGPVNAVQAYTATRLVNIETEDVGVAILKFASGALGVLEATTAARPVDLEGSLSILGETGSAVVSGFFANRMETWNFTNPLPRDEEARTSAVPDMSAFGHAEFYKDVVRCIGEKRRFMLDGLEGRKSLELITAIYESAATGQEVRLRYVPTHAPLGREHGR